MLAHNEGEPYYNYWRHDVPSENEAGDEGAELLSLKSIVFSAQTQL